MAHVGFASATLSARYPAGIGVQTIVFTVEDTLGKTARASPRSTSHSGDKARRRAIDIADRATAGVRQRRLDPSQPYVVSASRRALPDLY